MQNKTRAELFELSFGRDEISLENQISILRELGLQIPQNFVEGRASCDSFVEVLQWCSPQKKQFLFVDGEAGEDADRYLWLLEQISSTFDIPFQNVSQDNSNVRAEDGTGTVTLFYSLGAVEHQVKLDFMGDLIDFKIFWQLNKAITESNCHVGKKLYATDTMQGWIIFLCSEEWASNFQDATLCYTALLDENY